MNYYAVDNGGYCLAHHGIKGQKWGKRNYQNADGSYTAAGRLRYGIKGYRNHPATSPYEANARGHEEVGNYYLNNTNNLKRRRGLLNGWARYANRETARGHYYSAAKNQQQDENLRAVGRAKGLRKIPAMMGYGREARKARIRSNEYKAEVGDQLTNSHRHKLTKTIESRRSSGYQAQANREKAYQRARDHGHNVLVSYFRGNKAYNNTSMRSITGKRSTVGRERVKKMLASTAISAAYVGVKAYQAYKLYDKYKGPAKELYDWGKDYYKQWNKEQARSAVNRAYQRGDVFDAEEQKRLR